MARTKATTNQQRPESGAARDTEQPSLATGSMPPLESARIIERIRAYVRKHPEQAIALKRACEQAIEEERPPSEERSLRVTQAARRAGLTHGNLLRLLDAGRLGERNSEGQARYSEAEIDRYVASDRKRGPKPKNRPERP
jgi:hypothetical protein